MDIMSLMSNPNAIDDLVAQAGEMLSQVIHKAVSEAVQPLEQCIAANSKLINQLIGESGKQANRIWTMEQEVAKVNTAIETAKAKGGFAGRLLGA